MVFVDYLSLISPGSPAIPVMVIIMLAELELVAVLIVGGVGGFEASESAGDPAESEVTKSKISVISEAKNRKRSLMAQIVPHIPLDNQNPPFYNYPNVIPQRAQTISLTLTQPGFYIFSYDRHTS